MKAEKLEDSRLRRTEGCWQLQAETEGARRLYAGIEAGTLLGLLQAGTEKAQQLQARADGGRRIIRYVSLGGQNLVTGWAAAVSGWAFAHPVNMLAEDLFCGQIWNPLIILHIIGSI